MVRVDRLVVLDHETLVQGTAGPPLRLPCRPDRGAARRVTADLRHLGWVRLSAQGTEASAEVFASSRRPVRRRLPLAAALALAEAGVPTLLVRAGDR